MALVLVRDAFRAAANMIGGYSPRPMLNDSPFWNLVGDGTIPVPAICSQLDESSPRLTITKDVVRIHGAAAVSIRRFRVDSTRCAYLHVRELHDCANGSTGDLIPLTSHLLPRCTAPSAIHQCLFVGNLNRAGSTDWSDRDRRDRISRVSGC